MRKYLTLVLILLGLAPLQAQSLRISEFLATNFTGIVDQDGSPEGWIEIWNPSATGKVVMTGMKLTDGTTTWTFPAVDIMPDERMIVFASAKNRIVPTAPLHTNFKIPSGGGTIRLLAANNVVLSEFVNFPAQQPDVSYGRDEWDIAVNPTQVGFYSEPTPNERNDFSGPGVAGKVIFGTTSRAYTGTLPITLTQETPDPDAQIRYTVNGTVPTPSSTLYSGPINVTTTQQIRARVFKAGLLPGETESNAYLLLDGTTANFSSAMPLVVLTSFGAAISDTLDTPSFVWVWEPAAPDNRARFTNTPTFASRIVVDKRGSSTLNNPKFNLNMEFRKGRDDDDRNNVLLGMPSQSDWVLGAPYDFDRALIRNPLAYALSNAIGQYAPRTKQAEVFIDVTSSALSFTNAQSGDYFGVYNVTEKVRRDNDRVDVVNMGKYDNDSVKRTGGYIWKVDRIDAGDTGFIAGGQTMAYYDPKEIEIKSPQRDPQEQFLTAYINSFNNALQSASWNNPVTGYAAFLDVDAAIDHHLAMVWPFNVDALRLSGYWTKQRGAKMKPFPVWDYDRTMDSTDNRDDNPAVWRSTVSDFGTDFFNYIWWNRLFFDIDFYQKYIDRWQLLRRTSVTQAKVDAIIDALNAEISAEAVTRDLNRWARTKRPYTSPLTGLSYTGQTAEIQRIKDFLQRRANFMDSQWVGPVNVSVAEGNVPVGTQVTLTAPAGTTIYYTLDGADPRPSGGGLPGAGVLTYTGTPIEITQTTRLRARAYHPTWTAIIGNPNNPHHISKWSGLTNVRYSIDTRAAVGNLAVTEINFNPAGPSAAELLINPIFEAKDFEYIELKNVGSQPIDLGDAKFTSGINFTFSGQNAITVPPGGYFIASSNPAAFAARYGSSLQVVGPWGGDLSNQGERLVIRNFANAIILDFTYDDAWFPVGDGNGGSFEYVGTDYSKEAYEDPANWRDSSQVLGSPGVEGLGPAPVVIINEILTNSTLPRVDAIEFFNPGIDPVDMSGWYLSDAGGEISTDEFKKYKIPNGTVIAGGSYLVLTEINFNPNGAWNPSPGTRGPGEFALNADHGDDVWLIEADLSGNLKRFVAHSDFGASLPDESWGRFPNATGKLYPMIQRTLFDEASATVPLPGLGAANSTPRFGPLLISEVQHSPSVNSADLEFIEIYNPTATAQPLAHWQLRGSVDFDFSSETIPAGGTIVVTAFSPTDSAKVDAFKTFYHTPNAVLTGPWTEDDRLGATGEVVLYRAGTPPATEPNFYPQTWEDETNYENGGDWPTASGGPSLNRAAPAGLGDLPGSWVAQIANPGRPMNSAPVAVTDNIHALLTGGDLVLNVRANDTDVDGDSLTITTLGTPANGTAITDGNTITYTPGINYNGNDSFTYSINDGFGGTAAGTITLVNAMPVAAQDNLHATLVGGVASLNVLLNDTDPDNDPLVIVSVGTPSNGSAVTDGQVITYTPGPAFTGEDEFNYTIKDGHGGTSTATVMLGNTAPVAVNDTANTPGTPVTINVLANDSDPELDPLSVTLVSNGTFGTTAIEGTNVVYTPGGSFFGDDNFTYTVSDGSGGTAVGTVSIRSTTIIGRTEATTGTEVPGAPGMTYVSLQVPAIGNDGLLAWLANVKGAGVKSKAMLIGGNPASAMYSKGDPVPDLAGAVFSKLKTPVVDGAGRVAFIGTFTGSGITVKNNTAIFAMQPGGATSRVARLGDPAPDSPGAFAKFTAMDSADGETAYVATLSGKTSGVWAWDGTNHRRVLGSGDPLTVAAASKSVSSISLLGAVPGSPGHPRSHRGGELAMSVGFSDKSKGIALSTLDAGAWTTSVLALTAQPSAFGGTWKTFGPAALAAPGTIALSTTLAGVSKTNDTAIVLLRDGADPVLIAREGEPSPAGLNYKSFSDPVANSDGVISFAAKLGGASSTNDDVLVQVDALGTASVVARESDSVPDVSGVSWKKFVSFALPGQQDGGPIILAQVAGAGVTKKNNLGVWAQASDGSLVLVARTGTPITVNGSSKTPSKLVLLNALPPVQGSGRSFNEAHRVAFLATFTDGSQAIQVVRVP